MKVLQTAISPALHSYITVMEKKEKKFSAPLHCHPELELVYIKSGSGKRILGNTITPFHAGDIVLIGSGLPHRWICDDHDQTPCSIVAYFNKAVFSEVFYTLNESKELTELIAKANRGVNVAGTTRQTVSTKLEKLTRKKGFKKIIGLMEILHIISTSKEINHICFDDSKLLPVDTNADRLADVYQHMAVNFQKDISLDEIASMAALTPPAFCNFFKKRTGKSFIEYLTEIRISAACKDLLHTDLNISSIYSRCGFKTISNFNKSFKKITGISPKEYRRTVRM